MVLFDTSQVSVTICLKPSLTFSFTDKEGGGMCGALSNPVSQDRLSLLHHQPRDGEHRSCCH